MSADRWGRVQRAFEAALRDRAALSTCDADLREEVEQLLEQDDAAEREGFLTPPAGPRPLTGTRLGPYEVGEAVGAGGMGEVYRAARRDDYRQEVAIKVVRPGLAGGEGAERFRAERQALAQLQHPNVARLLDGGTTPDGRPYLVLEFIAGPPLDRYAADRPMAVKLTLFRAVCLAVAHAHAAGVIHRDLKPANVLVGADGQPRVTDFGLARCEDDSRLTAAGQVMGTPSYMAPEQARGAEAGPPADVWALGAILYELLTGRPPFRADSPRATIELVLATDPVAPRLLAPGLPRDLTTICLKCLEKDPARRYPSAQDLADDVGRLIAGDPIRARPVGVAERAVRWGRRNPGVAALTAALVLAVAGGFTGVTLLWLEADRQRGRAERRERLARAAADDLLRVAERTMDHLPRM
ncbi:MAG: serine/threonine-protein kinase, partial [Gemmataceae bacterium]